MTGPAGLVVAGGGPAGMMAGLLFARAGAKVTVLEKHRDFLRDFRGDTVHPSTMEVLHELGLLGRFLERPHNRLSEARLRIAGREWTIGDLSHLRTPAPFIAMMPQWYFLDFLRDEAEAWPGFRLEMEAPVESFIEEGDRIAGVRLADGSERRAELVIAADGRSSLVRSLGLLPVETLGAPMDVFWFRLPKTGEGGEALRGSADAGRLVVLIDRGAYWQVAMLIPKGGAEAVRAKGIGAVRELVQSAFPDLDLGGALDSTDDLHLLSVALDRLTCWHRPGLRAIGDAATQCRRSAGSASTSPSRTRSRSQCTCRAAGGGQGGRRPAPPGPAPQDVPHAADPRCPEARPGPGPRPPARLARAEPPRLRIVRLLDRYSPLRRIPGRFIGLGIRRERVRTPVFPSP